MKKTPIKLTRPPLTNEELEGLRADDLVRLKLSDDEKIRLRDINQDRARRREERSKHLRAEEESIVADLREVGLEVNSVWDLVNASNPYPEAISILLKHLVKRYSDRTKEGIARALAVPDARGSWSLLAAEYCRTPQGEENGVRLGAKNGLAAALSATATDEVIEQLASLAKNRSNGDSRLLLLSALRKSKTAVARKALEELADDPVLQREIASWSKAR
jgi:hypothetical protein